jgi:hypothetical protein
VKSIDKCRWAAVVLLASALHVTAEDSMLAPPAHDWTLPMFTKEGYRQMTIRGDEVHPVSSDRVDITRMNVTVFSGKPDAKIDSVLVSPKATFLLNEKIAKGAGAVHLVRDDVEVSGEGWTYIYNEKKVLISQHAHIVFHTALPDLLK